MSFSAFAERAAVTAGGDLRGLGMVEVGECSERERILMISEKRRTILDTIHDLEAQIMQLDCLRSEIRKKGGLLL